ncbi:MAG: type II toxin-antitoxin system RelE/ParE family toxin [Hyphomonadaceae bacterium]
MRFRVTARAQADLDDIADYSLRTWGRAQAARYLQALEARFQWLADNPQLGRARDEVAQGYRSFRQGSHIVFYTSAALDKCSNMAPCPTQP